MKHYILLLFVGFVLSCSNSDDVSFSEEADLQGSWLLMEQYSDPGDGSGDFRKVKSDKTIKFDGNGTFTVNGTLCNMTTDSGPESNGTYTVAEELTAYSVENHMSIEDCEFGDTRVAIQFDGGRLVLSYQCFEGCAQKYRKVSSN